MEIWKNIMGFEGLYQISDYGRIRSLINDILLKPRYQINGYEICTLCRKGRKRTFRVHRLVAEHFIENINNYPFVHHINENKKDNEATNLMWVTHIQNMKLFEKKIFETRASRKLNDEDIKEILLLKSNNVKQKIIASIFAVSPSCVSNIVNHKTRLK